MGQWRDVSTVAEKERYTCTGTESARTRWRGTPPRAFDARPIVPGACRAGMLVKKSARRARNVPTTPPTSHDCTCSTHKPVRPEPQTFTELHVSHKHWPRSQMPARGSPSALGVCRAAHAEACFFFVRLTLSRLSTCSNVCDASMILE